MKKVALFFIFKSSPREFGTSASESEAASIMKQFMETRTGIARGYVPEADMRWAIDLSDVACIYTRDPEQMQREALQAQQQQQRGKPSIPPTAWGFGSGQN